MTLTTGVLERNTIRVDAPVATYTHTKKAASRTASPRRKIKDNITKVEAKAFSEAKSVPGVSLLAIAGTIVISVLMIFVVLAQISYNETASEAARLSAYVRDLEQQQRVLELALESSFDIREVERIAKDELGMSKPDRSQILTIQAMPNDVAVVIVGGQSGNSQGFAEFLEALVDIFRR